MRPTSTLPRAAALILIVAGSAGCPASEVVFETDIEYSNPDGQHLKLNMARPRSQPDAGPLPAVVCIHGGGFRAGDRKSYDTLCRRLAERGYVALTVSYRLAPKFPFPAAVHDVKAAVRWLRAHAEAYRVDPDRIGVTGGSAGGHLAQFLGVTAGVPEFEGNGGNPRQSSRVACVVNVYGPSDFTKSYGKSVDAAEVLPLFLGGNLEQARRRHIVASPLSWVTPDAAPTLCIHGTRDPYVAFEQATWLVDRLKVAGVEAELLALEGAGHGFKGDDARRAEQALFAFFDAHLKAGRTELEAPTPSPLPDPAAVRPTLYGTGFAFAEGPAIDRAGNLYVVNYRAMGTIGKITPEGAASVLVDLRKALPADGDQLPSCNGLKVDDDGNLIGAETGTSQVVRIARDGRKVEVLVREVGGQRLRGLNDVALDPAGNVFFSNPGQRNVYRWNKAGGSVDRLNTEPIASNGIGITPDGKHLVTSDDGRMRLMILDLVDGKGTNQRELISFRPPGTPDDVAAAEMRRLIDKGGTPDGFIFDEFGRLYVGMWSGGVIHVVEVPSGKLLATYNAGGSQATNAHFFGGDLYVTVAAKEAVFKLPLGIRGWRYSKGCGY